MLDFHILMLVILLIGMSAICSGLNLSLMSLSISDLKRQALSGDRRAAAVLPLRRNVHLSLAAILLGNVGFISSTSLVLDHKYSGLIAGAASTLLIVVFGEIIPQALFAQRALGVTAFFAPLLRVLIIATYPISKPLQLLLDKLFGKHQEKLHSRQELGLIIAEHTGHGESELDPGEVEIIKGALLLSEKRVKEITTPLNATYWLQLDTVIDAAKIDEIKSENWSRIPIFDNELEVVEGLLLMKDLVDIDFDERPYKVSELPLRKTKTVGSQTALDTLFKKFIAAKTHLLAVERDDKIIGVVTIEDLIEEILGQEIEDETDQF